MPPPSTGGLPEGLRDLARTSKLDANATIREDQLAMSGVARASLPRIVVGDGPDADVEPFEVIGQGGMGQVRLARQRGLDREVAMKVVRPGSRSSAVAALLTAEGLITGRLEHPNIVPVYLLGQDDAGDPVIVMKRVEGVPWSRLDKKRSNEHSTERHLDVFLEVCKALSFAHARGFVHRDVKPDNVMVGHFGEVYLVDWGISARIGIGAFDHVPGDGPGMPLGTPLYMAPEMCRTEGILDERTDVYLMGATLHRVLTGKHRHVADGLPAVLLAAAVSEPFPYRDEIPDELASICNKATARDPTDRFPTIAALRDAVIDYRRHRVSIELAREAEAILDEIEAAVETTLSVDKRRLFTECRFAFMRALKDWPDNDRARRGLQRCLEIMTVVEIEAGQLDAASAWLDEMPEPNRKLRQIVAGQRAEKIQNDEQVASLRRMAHELDPSVSKGARASLAVVLALLTGVTLWIMSRQDPEFAFSPRGALTIAPAVFGVSLVAGYALRKRLFATMFNRRVTMLVALALVTQPVVHLLSWVTQPTFAHMIAMDLLVCAVVSAAAGVTLSKAFFIPAAIWVAGTGLVVALPQYPQGPYAVGLLSGLIAFAGVFYRRKG